MLLKYYLMRYSVKIDEAMGRAVAKCRNRKQIDRRIRTVLVNKADRIGDAIVTLPFLLELKKRYDVTVLTSNYNDFILKKFFPTVSIDYRSASLEKEATSFKKEGKNRVKKFFQMLKIGLIRKREGERYDAFIDLTFGGRNIEGLYYAYRHHLARYYIGANRGLFNFFQNYSMPSVLRNMEEYDVVDYYERLIHESLGVRIKTPDYLDPRPLEKDAKRQFDFNHPFVLIFVGGEPKRNLSSDQWEVLIERMSRNTEVLVIDDQSYLTLPILKKKIRNKRVHFIRGKYSLFDLLALSKKANFFIGVEGGGTHFLSFPVNALLIFTAEMAHIFRPHSNKPYKKSVHHGSFVIEETTTSKGLTKAAAYVDLSCRPCFIRSECKDRKCVKQMDLVAIADYVKSRLKK